MTHDEKVNALTELATRACETDVCTRLYGALLADALVTRIIGSDNPNIAAIRAGMSRHAIIEAAHREVVQLTDDERTNLRDVVIDQIQWRIATATRHCWTVAEVLEYDPNVITPEGVAWLAAVYAVPVEPANRPTDE